MHEIWCLGSDDITIEVIPTAQVDVGAEVVGQFSSNYLAKNWRRTPIFGQNFINESVELLVIPNFSVDPCLLRISCVPTIPQVGETVVPPIRTGPFPSLGDLTSTFMSCGVVTSLPVLFTCPGGWRVFALLRTASVMTYFVVGVVCA